MTKAKALKAAQAKFGPKGYVRLNRRVTWTEADRVKARADLSEHRAAKPTREAANRLPPEGFRAWRDREEELMTIALSYRCEVGTLSDEIGFAIFGIRGSGDAWEDALERAGALVQRSEVCVE